MAVTLDTAIGTGNAGATSSCTLTTTATVASDAHIILIAGRFCSVAPTSTLSVSGGSLTWTEDHTATSGNVRTSIFRAPVPAGLASGTVLTITNSSSGTDLITVGGSFLGIDTTGTVIAFNGTGSGSTAWSSGSVAGTSGAALIGGAFGDGVAGTSTPTAPGVELVDFNVAGQAETATLVYKLSVAGADTVAGTWSGAMTSVAVAVAYKAAAGGAVVDTPRTFNPIPFMR